MDVNKKVIIYEVYDRKNRDFIIFLKNEIINNKYFFFGENKLRKYRL